MNYQNPNHSHLADKNHAHHQNLAKNYHHEAATHLQHAAKSYLEASRMRELGNHEASATHALIAHAQLLQALAHSKDAIKEHANLQSAVQRP